MILLLFRPKWLNKKRKIAEHDIWDIRNYLCTARHGDFLLNWFCFFLYSRFRFNVFFNLRFLNHFSNLNTQLSVEASFNNKRIAIRFSYNVRCHFRCSETLNLGFVQLRGSGFFNWGSFRFVDLRQECRLGLVEFRNIFFRRGRRCFLLLLFTREDGSFRMYIATSGCWGIWSSWGFIFFRSLRIIWKMYREKTLKLLLILQNSHREQNTHITVEFI